MHRIKHNARREAWYNSDEDEVKTYNFFGRAGPQPRKIRDEENSPAGQELHHTSTENDATSPIEAKRQEEYRSEFKSPPKSGTFPGPPRSADNGFLRPGQEGSEIDHIPSSSEDSTDGTGRAVRFEKEKEEEEMVDKSAGPTNGESKPRKRKLRKFMPWKKNQDSDPTKGGDYDDEDSSKEKKKKKNAKGQNITFMSQFRAVFYSWINILLVAVPAGIALNYAGVNKIVVFVVNFIAIIPLAGMLAYATEELAMYIGEVLGGLLNATFGNAVELIVGVIALAKGEILIVQTSLIGSMLSNLLLVLGMCFFFGGLRRVEQFFNVTVAQTGASLLALATGSLVVPTALKIFGIPNNGVAPASRGTAVLLLLTYGCYLFFQLRTHVEIYNEPSQKSPKKPSRKKSEGDAMKAMMTSAGASAGASGGQINQENLSKKQDDDDDEAETPSLSKIGALVTLAGSTVLVALCAEFMVGSISTVAESISQEFIGLILLPIVGNAAEHATAVTVAIKDKMDLAIGVCVGSSLQIALLVLPVMVLLNWWGVGAGSKEGAMTLSFGGFQIVVLFVAVIVVNYLIQDGKSHWLEGVMLQITYVIIAIAAFYYPVPPNEQLS